MLIGIQQSIRRWKEQKKLQNLLRVFSVCTKKQKEIKIIHHWNPFSHIVWQITNTQYFKRLCKIDNFKTNRICGANWKLTEMTSRQVYDRTLTRKFFENQKFQMTPKLPSENCTYYTLFQKSIFCRTKIIFPIFAKKFKVGIWSEISICFQKSHFRFVLKLSILKSLLKYCALVFCQTMCENGFQSWIIFISFCFFVQTENIRRRFWSFFFHRQNCDFLNRVHSGAW